MSAKQKKHKNPIRASRRTAEAAPRHQSERSSKVKKIIAGARLTVLGAFLALIGSLFQGTCTNLLTKTDDGIHPPTPPPNPPKLPRERTIAGTTFIPLTETYYDGGQYARPPKMEVLITSPDPTNQEGVFRLGKKRLYPDASLPCVREEYVAFEPLAGRPQYAIVLDSDGVIVDSNSRTPHGIYSVSYTLTRPVPEHSVGSAYNDQMEETRTSAYAVETTFNYVYIQDFRDLAGSIKAYAEGFGNILQGEGGLSIVNTTKGNGFISADIVQEFDFKTNFSIAGVFTMAFDAIDAPCGLQIAICDRWGEKLSVGIPDGARNEFSIKQIGEDYRDEQVVVKSDVFIEPAIDGKPMQFTISVWTKGDQTRCSLNITRGRTSRAAGAPVHERIIDAGLFFEEFIHINVKLYRAGQVNIYKLTVAEQNI